MLRKSPLCLLVILAVMRIQVSAQTSSGTKPPSTASSSKASPPAKGDSVEARVEKYLRNLYAWGPEFELKVGPAKPSEMPELLEVPVTVSMGGQSDTAVVYVSKTGNFLLRGELTDMSKDPFADVRAKLKVGNSPSIGPENAKITMIEFADFECPACRQLDLFLRPYLKEHPEIRLVFKHYPLTEIHPWAMTAAIASQCAYHESPAAFWKMHDAIFDAQDAINPDNVRDKLQELANQQGLNEESYKACIINPKTESEVNATIQEGHELKLTATPTTFINARKVVGPDNSAIRRFFAYINII